MRSPRLRILSDFPRRADHLPMPKTRPVLLLELNEVNFELVSGYVRLGRLPTLGRLIDAHGLLRTTSERRYEELEPWIQWVTAHAGVPLAEHGVFRLGDIVTRDLPQIWELLEDAGLRVGAISPMNASLRARDPAFFVPDPWTSTGIVAPPALRYLYLAIRQAVNDNAQSRITPRSLIGLAVGAAAYCEPRSWQAYARMLVGSRSGPWRKAMILDRLLADVFISEIRRTRPDFATLFVNAAAHIQHHYMFCSAAYQGTQRNPQWYAPTTVDPVLEAYELYDAIVDDVIRAFPSARIMLATGLHQVPHDELTYYWRLRDHAAFLTRIGVTFLSVEPRMSRDFLITFRNAADARKATETLASARASDGVPLFQVDNRGTDAFVILTYPRSIDRSTSFTVEGRAYQNLAADTAFVAIKNGKHHGIGYFIDTGHGAERRPEPFPLAQLPARIFAAFGLPLPASLHSPQGDVGELNAASDVGRRRAVGG